jgi:hypothetical protein
MPEQLQTWWQTLSPEMQTAAQFGGVVVGALIVGQILGMMTFGVLSRRKFDAVLRLPSASPPDPEADSGFTPSYVASLLVRLTVWAGAAWWLAQKHGRTDLAHTLGMVINRAWAVAAILTASLAVGSLTANRLIACFGGTARANQARAGATTGRWDAAGAVGAGVYVLVLLLVLLVAADLFDWPLTRTSAEALWQFTQRLFIALAALSIGCLGAGWARDMAMLDGPTSPEKRAGQYTGLVITAASTVLAVSVLLSSAGVLIGLAALAVFGSLLWMARGWFPDIAAGLQLRAHKVDLIQLDGQPWQVNEVGFITTEVSRRGEFSRLPNRQVLAARMQGAAAQTASH